MNTAMQAISATAATSACTSPKARPIPQASAKATSPANAAPSPAGRSARYTAEAMFTALRKVSRKGPPARTAPRCRGPARAPRRRRRPAPPWRTGSRRASAAAASSERVHQGADDARAGVRQLPHGALGVVDARLVAPREEQHVAGAERHALRVGVVARRRRVDQHDVVLALRL